MPAQCTRVLLIEDDREDYVFTRSLLREAGRDRYRIDWVANYADGLGRLLSGEHDICLLDDHLGTDDGLELLREASAHAGVPPIILLTGRADNELDERAIAMGAADFLVKSSLNPTILDRSIRYSMERARADRATRILAAIVESSRDAIIAAGTDGSIVAWNGGAERLFGVTAGDAMGMQLSWIWPANQQEETRQLVQQVLSGESILSHELRQVGAARPDIHLSSTLSPIRDAAGKVSGIACILRDVTDQVLSEKALIESQKRLRGIIDSAMDAIITIDSEQRIVIFNPAAEKLFGYPAERMLGQSMEALIPERLRPGHEQKIRDFEKAGISTRRMGQSEAVIGRRADGHEFPMEASISHLSIAGQSFSTVIMRDITDRKQAEKTSNYLAELIDSSDDAIIGRTLDGKILSWNPAAARIFGYSAEEILGQSFTILTPPEVAHETEGLQRLLSAGQRLDHYETVRRRKDGRLIDVSLTISPMRNEANAIVGASVIARDITERVRLERQLRQAQKMEALGTLAGGIAHDFNNILAAIIGYSEMACDETTTPEQARSYTEEVLKAAGRAAELVQQILTFSRRKDRKLQPVSLEKVVNEAIKLLRPSLPSTIDIRKSSNAPNPMILADPSETHQIIMNLAANAAYAMKDTGGVLEIAIDLNEAKEGIVVADRTLPPGNYIELVVRDTGTGIAPDVLDRIYEPFFTTKPQGEGTGMGLSVVHGVVASYGGAIRIQSTVGLGTAASAYFPAMKSTAAQRLDSSGQAELPRGSGEKILVVEDEASLANLMGEVLVDLGYRVTCTQNGAEALEEFLRHPAFFDAVITDKTMPKMTGDLLARELLVCRPNLPIILMSGFSDRIDAQLAAQLGIRRFLKKPVMRQELARCLREVLQRN